MTRRKEGGALGCKLKGSNILYMQHHFKKEGFCITGRDGSSIAFFAISFIQSNCLGDDSR